MSDELLARAARALRDSHDGESDAAARTRAQILLLATPRRRRRRLAVVVLLPIAAALAISTAWAAATGRLPRWLALSRDEPRNTPATVSHEPALPPSTPVAIAPEDAGLEQDGSAADTGASTSPAPLAIVPSTRAVTHDSLPTPATSDRSTSQEELLFATAQHQHFVVRDPAAALRAWDAYLAAYPHGRLALEARYNRALTLVRLGRNDEARVALQPFAAGGDGSYRQREATALLRALDGGAP